MFKKERCVFGTAKEEKVDTSQTFLKDYITGSLQLQYLMTDVNIISNDSHNAHVECFLIAWFQSTFKDKYQQFS